MQEQVSKYSHKVATTAADVSTHNARVEQLLAQVRPGFEHELSREDMREYLDLRNRLNSSEKSLAQLRKNLASAEVKLAAARADLAGVDRETAGARQV
jgi:hypothetical protein